MATPVYNTGFEHGTQLVTAVGVGLAANTSGNGTGTVGTDAKRAGGSVYGLKLVTTGANADKDYGIFNPNTQTFVGSFQWCPSVKPTTARKDILYHIVGSIFPGFIYDPTKNKITAEFISGSGANFTKDSSITITTGQFYRIDYKLLTNGTSWTLDWSIDGVAQTQAVLTGQIATTISMVAVSCNGTEAVDATGATWFYDDMIWSATSGDYPLGEVIILGATADQTVNAEHSGITLSQWQYTDNFSAFTDFASTTETASRSRIDDLSTGDGIRMNAAGSIAGNAQWLVADPVGDPGTVPIAVTLIFTGREASAGSNNVAVGTRIGAAGTTLFHINANPAWDTTWNYLRYCMAVRPGDSAAWTNQDVKDLRFVLDSTDATPNIWIGGFYYEIAYPPVPTQIKKLAGLTQATVKKFEGQTLATIKKAIGVANT